MARKDDIMKLLESSPDDVFLNFSLAMEYKAAGQAEDALRQFDRTIELDESYLAAYLSKGELLLAAHRFDEARAHLERAAEVARAADDRHMLDNITQLLSHLP